MDTIQYAIKQITVLNAPEWKVMYRHSIRNLTLHLDYTLDQILEEKELKRFYRKNTNNNENIYVTPISKVYDYWLIDDVKDINLIKNKYNVCLIIETSPDNYQVVIKTHNLQVDQELKNAFFKDLNIKYGDKNISAYVHPMRLAGYHNLKEKYRDANGNYPLVKLIYAQDCLCSTLESELVNFQMPLEEEKTVLIKTEENEENKDINELIISAKKCYFQCRKEYRDKVDWSVADFRVMQNLIRKTDADTVISIVKQCSPNLLKRKGNNVDKYLKYSMKKVLEKFVIKEGKINE
jgi:hypothetical protein